MRTAAMIALLATVASCSDAKNEIHEPAAGPSILLLVNDAWRRDSVGIYGGGSALTPRLDATFSRGVVFEHATAQSSCTINSAPSMIFGVHPSEHHYRGYKDRVSPRLVSAAEILARSGYDTYALSTNPHVSVNNGLAQGFEEFIDPGGWTKTACAEVNERFLAWLDERGDRGFFAMLWYTDTHVPYEPPPAHVRRQVHGDLIDLVGDRTARPDGKTLTPEEKVVARALYDASVSYFDDETGRLLDRLESRGVLEDTVVILTSDHGEAFWDRRSPTGVPLYGHGSSLYPPQTDIPLLMKGPGLPSARVSAPVQHIDLLPTICDLAGVEPATPYSLRGASAIPLIESRGDGTDRPIFTELLLDEYGPYRIRAGRHRGLSVIRNHILEGEAFTPPLVEREVLRRSARGPDRASADALESRLDRFVSALRPERFPASRAGFLGDEMTELERRLANLGYLQ